MMGRPKLPADQRQDAELRIRLTDSDRKFLNEAAERAHAGDKHPPGGNFTSTWAREVLLRAAARILHRRP